MLERERWLSLSRKLDWDYSYVSEAEVFPEVQSGRPVVPSSAWRQWDEPFRISYREYVGNQSRKDAAVAAVHEAVGKTGDFQRLPPGWLSGLKLHAALLPLAEFAAVIGELRGARFGRDSAWRTACTFGGLDELRHTQIPLLLMHELLRWDGQFDWTHRFYHSNNWVAIAARHLADELLLASDAIEFAIATNFVFETGFTNLQFVGLASLAHQVGDSMFEKMLTSIQTDEARHSQIGHSVLRIVQKHDPAYAQFLVDKWFWRSARLFAVATGFAMDYFTPLEQRTHSFKDFMKEWILEQFACSLHNLGLRRPFYWDAFIDSLDSYHHMVYASAYSYRSSVWFDFVLPGPGERAWLRSHYPRHWDQLDAVWERITQRWAEADPGNELAVHGTSVMGFCDLCQLVLSGGTPQCNSATTLDYGDRRYIFCSPQCRFIFEQEPARYAGHRDVVKRVLAGEAPANLLALLRQYFGLSFETWGRDAYGGAYSFIPRPAAAAAPSTDPAGAGVSAHPGAGSRRAAGHADDESPLLPLYGFLMGDTMGLLIQARADQTVAELCDSLQAAAAVRVARRPHVKLLFRGNEVARERSLADAGFHALDRFDVVAADAPASPSQPGGGGEPCPT